MNHLLLLVSLFVTTYTHDIQVAYFTFHQEDGQLLIDINFEKEDLLSTLDLTEEDLTNGHILSYLKENFEVKLNGIETHFRLKNVDQKENHLQIVCLVGTSPTKLNSIIVDNTCFLDIEDHSNIIEIKLENQERGFLSNKDRTNIIIHL